MATTNCRVTTARLKPNITHRSRHPAVSLATTPRRSPNGTKVTTLETVSLSPVCPSVANGMRLRGWMIPRRSRIRSPKISRPGETRDSPQLLAVGVRAGESRSLP
jgi:hypothetical protein